jgi:glyoxylase-like metal-dependent hydrolase (beta-lactamase superfamily II)
MQGRRAHRAGGGLVAAVVLTHAHFDHMGFAERARRELGVPLYVHENDAPLTRHPLRYDPTSRRSGGRSRSSRPRRARAHVLVGHGEPWTRGAEAAVTAARAAGVA